MKPYDINCHSAILVGREERRERPSRDAGMMGWIIRLASQGGTCKIFYPKHLGMRRKEYEEKPSEETWIDDIEKPYSIHGLS